MSTQQSGAKIRDPRVDFFRGLAFIIIFIAHVPANWLAQWIPARFGLSDATEMFVFMSGYAAAIAFGATFGRAGYWLGTARVAFRGWQVYTAHLTLFFFIAAIVAIANSLTDVRDYIGQLNLYYFFQETGPAMVGLFTLTYVPNFFDILPMYIVVLVMMPIVMVLARIHPNVALGACVALYVYTWTFGLELPAEVRPGNDRPWFFNPFGWQLIFYTGFAIAMGWIKAPPRNTVLMWLAIAFIVFFALVSRRFIVAEVGFLQDVRDSVWTWSWQSKTDLGILRYIHFLAIAYVTVVLLKGHEQRILLSRWLRPVIKCGQQSLPVFLFSMVLSRLAGIALDQTGREIGWVLLINAAGIGSLIGIAYLLGWLKAEPWRKRRTPHAVPSPSPAPLPTPDAAPAAVEVPALASAPAAPRTG